MQIRSPSTNSFSERISRTLSSVLVATFFSVTGVKAQDTLPFKFDPNPSFNQEYLPDTYKRIDALQDKLGLVMDYFNSGKNTDENGAQRNEFNLGKFVKATIVPFGPDEVPGEKYEKGKRGNIFTFELFEKGLEDDTDKNKEINDQIKKFRAEKRANLSLILSTDIQSGKILNIICSKKDEDKVETTFVNEVGEVSGYVVSLGGNEAQSINIDPKISEFGNLGIAFKNKRTANDVTVFCIDSFTGSN